MIALSSRCAATIGRMTGPAIFWLIFTVLGVAAGVTTAVVVALRSRKR